jgi:hypothetical protein
MLVSALEPGLVQDRSSALVRIFRMSAYDRAVAPASRGRRS